ASRCVARARAVRSEAVRRPAAEPVRVLPFRRRRAPLPRDGVRALRDEGGAGGGGVARRAPPRDRVPHAARAAEHHALAVEGHAGGSRAAGRMRTIPAGTLLWRGRVRPATLCAVPARGVCRRSVSPQRRPGAAICWIEPGAHPDLDLPGCPWMILAHGERERAIEQLAHAEEDLEVLPAQEVEPVRGTEPVELFDGESE